MHRFALLVPALLGTLFTACASNPAPSPDVQEIVDSIQGIHADVVRLTVHSTPPGGGTCYAIASTQSSKRGLPSDPEDLQAISTGKNVILQESGALDVTVPILQKSGKYTAAAGVTLKSPVGARQDDLVARAEAIAREIGQRMEANMQK